MADQSKKMSPPKKPIKPKRKSLLELGPSPIRMVMMYASNKKARKEFEAETIQYEKKKAAYDEAMKQLKPNSKKEPKMFYRQNPTQGKSK